jgi:hypothetical protein
MFFVSCSSGGGGGSGDPVTLTGEQLYNAETKNPYTGSGKIYMMERRGSNDGKPILTEDNMLLFGTVNNGKINLSFPSNVPSHFLQSFEDAPEPLPPGMSIEPLSVKVWIYVNPLYLVGNDGKLIGFIDALNGGEETDRIAYWYYSENASMSGALGSEGTELQIDAERGWNKVHWIFDKTAERLLVTTDLSNVPEDLMWMLWEY